MDDVIECPGCGILLLATEPSCPKCSRVLAQAGIPGGANSPPSATGGRIADADEIAALEAEIESLRRGILIRRTIPLLLWLVAAIGLALFFLGWL